MAASIETHWAVYGQDQPAKMGLGDVLVFQCNQMPHVAIVGPWPLIHSHQGASKVVEAIYDEAWVERVRGVDTSLKA